MSRKLKPERQRRVKVPEQPPLLSLFRGTVDPARSAQMGRIRGKDTGPELALRSAVWSFGGRFRIHPADLPGRPDLANRRAKVAVFVDGCFWHGCPRHFKPPRTRREFWEEKIRRNEANRKRHLSEYSPEWQVFQVYECQIREDLAGWALKVAQAMAK